MWMPPTGERLEIERLTSRSERGRWKSTHKGNSLTAYSTASSVLNGGDEETGLVRPRLVTTQRECGLWYRWPSRRPRSTLSFASSVPLPAKTKPGGHCGNMTISYVACTFLI